MSAERGDPEIEITAVIIVVFFCVGMTIVIMLAI
jgi:hypothetical protein